MLDELESLFPSPTGQNPVHGKQLKSAKRIADKMFARITKKTESERLVQCWKENAPVGDEISIDESGPSYQGVPVLEIVLQSSTNLPESVIEFLRSLLLVKGL